MVAKMRYLLYFAYPLSDDEWSDVINHKRDTSVFNGEPTEKSKKKKNKAEKKLLNESRDKSDAESMDLNGQRNDLISKILDSSIMNDSTASSTSSKKSKKRKHKDEEKVPTNDGDSKVIDSCNLAVLQVNFLRSNDFTEWIFAFLQTFKTISRKG